MHVFPCRSLREYLREIPEPQQYEALVDLVAAHLTFSWRVGTQGYLEAYLDEFQNEFRLSSSGLPESVEESPAAELIEDEFLARFQLPHGDKPLIREYESRFPNCRDAIASIRQRSFGDDRFVRLSKLGQGAMGQVWKAYDRVLHRLVAIKQPREDVAQKPDVLRRFESEARITASLDHPGIACVHEIIRCDETPICVMRYAGDHVLSDRIREYHLFSDDDPDQTRRAMLNRLLSSFGAVCEATAFAHSQGILHRDLKPGNVAVGEYGESVILDWGMAAKSGGMPQRDTESLIVGTPEYMPPEQVTGSSDSRSDVFGLGAILYEILTGRPPYDWVGGLRPSDWRSTVAAADIPTPRRLSPDTPAQLEAICLKALAPRAEDRYQNAAAVAKDVQRWQADDPISACAEPLLAGLRRRLRRAL